MTTIEILQESIHEKFGIALAELGPDVVLEHLDLDSLALIELTLTLQKRLGVALATGDITPQHTVEQAAGVLTDAQAKAAR